MALAQLEVEQLPTIACTGVVKKIHKPEPSKTEGSAYHVARIDFEAENGPVSQPSTFLVYDPNWFASNFDAKVELAGVENKGKRFLYGKNIITPKGSRGQSVLEALSNGSFEELAGIIDKELGGEYDPDKFQEILAQFEGQEIGIVLKQQQEKTDELNEKGRNVYVRQERYGVDRLFTVTDDSIKSFEKSAKKAAERATKEGKDVQFKVAWEEEG